MTDLTFTGKTFLVAYRFSRHLLGRRDIRLNDAEQQAFDEFLDSVDPFGHSRDRWVVTTPDGKDGLPGVCAITGRESDSLERVALISWTGVPS